MPDSPTYLDLDGLTTYDGLIKAEIDGRQEALVSGTNIKTINDQSLLGSGNLTVQEGTEMVVLAYGKSTWADFISVYPNAVVYCRASSNSNPASGSQTRMAFMAYVNNETNPTNVEFQYYRSVNSHSATQQGDQVYIYKLDKTAGWSVTTREAYTRITAGTGMTQSYASGTLTLQAAVASVNGSTGAVTVQPTLVSGTNIKTINGMSILGSGNITTPTYTLPTASTSTLGGVKVDGSTITIADGVISSSGGGGSVTMEDTAVDAAVEAAWPAPTGYAITPNQVYVEMGHLLAIGLSDEVEQGEFVATAGEGETVYVMGVGHWEPNVTTDSTGTSVSWNFYSSSQNIKLYTFTMPAEAVTVAMNYND